MEHSRDNQPLPERLARLKEVPDLEVADDDPDVRGWHLVEAGGRKVGDVDELIVDPLAMKVRYLETHLNVGDRRVLIPIERTVLDRDGEKVIVSLNATDLRGLPPCPVEVTEEFTREYDAEWETRWGSTRTDPQSALTLRRFR